MTEVFYSEIFRKPIINKSSLSKLLNILPKNIYLAYTIQYKNLAKEIKSLLEKNRCKIDGFEQVLGCSKIPQQDTILLVGEERFHALNLVKFSNKVIVFDGEKFFEISEKEKKLMKNREKAKISKFLYSTNIGLLVSIKNQSNLENAVKIRNILAEKYPDKNFQIFLFDTLDYKELENFQIDIWVNLACPGIEYDSKNILNIDSLPLNSP
jgi:diphthamide biosynthesis enzyme Dph1/Dph2-like protein